MYMKQNQIRRVVKIIQSRLASLINVVFLETEKKV